MAERKNNFTVYRRTSANGYDYASGSVYGNVAYDLDRLPREEEKPQERVKVKVRTYRETHSAQGVSMFAVVGFALFAVMMVFVLLAKVQLTQITNETVKMESQIRQLKDDEARLKIDYESKFNLTEIENYAVKTLGMVRTSGESVTMLESANVDRAEVLAENDMVGSFFTEFKDFVTSLLAYF